VLRGRRLQERADAVPFWWHSIDLGHGVVTAGHKSADTLRRELEALALPDLTGRSVLDIGGWDGWFAFEAERRGAARVGVVDPYMWAMDSPASRPTGGAAWPGGHAAPLACSTTWRIRCGRCAVWRRSRRSSRSWRPRRSSCPVLSPRRCGASSRCRAQRRCLQLVGAERHALHGALRAAGFDRAATVAGPPRELLEAPGGPHHHRLTAHGARGGGAREAQAG
jgi:hypothetical protein